MNRNWLAPKFHYSVVRWMMDGACNDYDPLWWDTDSASTAERRKAMQICWLECPVRKDCLAFSLTKAEPTGIWGGHYPEERRRLLRRQGRKMVVMHREQ